MVIAVLLADHANVAGEPAVFFLERPEVLETLVAEPRVVGVAVADGGDRLVPPPLGAVGEAGGAGVRLAEIARLGFAAVGPKCLPAEVVKVAQGGVAGGAGWNLIAEELLPAATLLLHRGGERDARRLAAVFHDCEPRLDPAAELCADPQRLLPLPRPTEAVALVELHVVEAGETAFEQLRGRRRFARAFRGCRGSARPRCRSRRRRIRHRFSSAGPRSSPPEKRGIAALIRIAPRTVPGRSTRPSPPPAARGSPGPCPRTATAATCARSARAPPLHTAPAPERVADQPLARR